MSEEIVDSTFASVSEAIEKEHLAAKAAAETGVKSAKQKTLSNLKA